jgi:glutaredoxin
MRELVPVFCMNPRLHDEALLSIPIGQAWRYLRDNEFDVLDSQTVLYRHKGYGGHWFLREPFQDSEFNEFRIVPGKSVKLRVLEDRRADTLVATKEISDLKTCKEEASGLSVRRHDLEFPGRYDEVYLCDPTGSTVVPLREYMYEVWTISEGVDGGCPFCGSAIELLQTKNKSFDVTREIQSDAEIAVLEEYLGISSRLQFPVIFYVERQSDGSLEAPTIRNMLRGGYGELLTHIKNN